MNSLALICWKYLTHSVVYLFTLLIVSLGKDVLKFTVVIMFHAFSVLKKSTPGSQRSSSFHLLKSVCFANLTKTSLHLELIFIYAGRWGPRSSSASSLCLFFTTLQGGLWHEWSVHICMVLFPDPLLYHSFTLAQYYSFISEFDIYRASPFQEHLMIRHKR